MKVFGIYNQKTDMLLWNMYDIEISSLCLHNLCITKNDDFSIYLALKTK